MKKVAIEYFFENLGKIPKNLHYDWDFLTFENNINC